MTISKPTQTFPLEKSNGKNLLLKFLFCHFASPTPKPLWASVPHVCSSHHLAQHARVLATLFPRRELISSVWAPIQQSAWPSTTSTRSISAHPHQPSSTSLAWSIDYTFHNYRPVKLCNLLSVIDSPALPSVASS